MTVQEGDKAWTPHEPFVMVEVLSTYHNSWSDRDLATVRFLADYHFHRAGSEGEFYLEDLTKVDENAEEDRTCLACGCDLSWVAWSGWYCPNEAFHHEFA